MCALVLEKGNPQSAQIVASCVEDPGVVRYRYSKVGRSCLKFVIVDVFSDRREEYAEQEAGEVCWYPFVPSAAERAAFHRLVAAGETGDPWPLIIPIEDSGHTFEPCFSRAWMMEVVEWARRGHPDAKRALMLILETERNGSIIAQLISHGIRWQDIEDLHHEALVRITERIEQLQWTAAYYKWEARIVRDLCRPWWRLYREMGAPLEALPEIQAKPTACKENL